MKNSKFIDEIISRLSESSTSEVLSVTENAFSTDSEVLAEAFVGVMDAVGLGGMVKTVEDTDGDGHPIVWVKFDMDAVVAAECLGDVKYITRFLCGDIVVEEKGFETADDACCAAANFSTDENCDYAEVLRVEENPDGPNAEVRLMWINTCNEGAVEITSDDSDYEDVMNNRGFF